MGHMKTLKLSSVANAATEALSPFILVAVILTWVAWLTESAWIQSAVIAVLFISVIPMGMSLVMTRRGLTTDKFIRHRKQRHLFYALTLVSVLAGTSLILLLPSSFETRWMAVLSVGTMVAVMVINTRLKISIHALIAAVFAVIIPAGLFHPALVAAGLLVWALASWSRVYLRRHTLTEVLLGTALGGGVGFLFLWLVGWLPWS